VPVDVASTSTTPGESSLAIWPTLSDELAATLAGFPTAAGAAVVEAFLEPPCDKATAPAPAPAPASAAAATTTASLFAFLGISSVPSGFVCSLEETSRG